MTQRSRDFYFRTHIQTGIATSVGRLFLAGCLIFSLLWVAHPLFAGQRRSGGLSGNQIAALQKQSLSRRQLKALHLVLLQYTSDNDGLLPALDSPAKLRAQLRQYRLMPSALICPFSNKAYLANKNLAGKKLKSIAKPASTLLFWSGKAMPDGNYLALDTSGRDRRITSSELARMKRISQIP
jgi:hypothetical protein